MRYLLLLMLIFGGCEDKSYTKIYNTKMIGLSTPTLSLSETNQSIKNMLAAVLVKEGFHIDSASLYTIEVDADTYHHKCNNPNTATYDATYDGFVKLTLLKGMKRLYMCQKDYHGELNSKVFATLFSHMKKEFKLHP